MAEIQSIDGRGISGNSPMTHFGAANESKRRATRGKSDLTLIREAIIAETGKDMAEFWRTVVKKATGKDGSSYMKMILDRLVPTAKPTMNPVQFDLPINGTAIEQAQAVLAAVAEGALPLDYAGPLLQIIQLIDVAKGGTLGNAGLDLSELYKNTGNDPAEFAAQIAALQKKPVIDVASHVIDPPSDPITAAIEREVEAIAQAVERDQDEAAALAMIEAASKRLLAAYPAGNTNERLYNAIVDALNARQEGEK